MRPQCSALISAKCSSSSVTSWPGCAETEAGSGLGRPLLLTAMSAQPPESSSYDGGARSPIMEMGGVGDGQVHKAGPGTQHRLAQRYVGFRKLAFLLWRLLRLPRNKFWGISPPAGGVRCRIQKCFMYWSPACRIPHYNHISHARDCSLQTFVISPVLCPVGFL